MERAAASFVQHPRCPFCREGVQPSQPKAACDACMTWHHAECWDEHGGCAACGGGAAVGAEAPGALALEEPGPPEPPPERGPRGRGRRGGRLPSRLRRLSRPAGVEIRANERELVLSHRWGSPLRLLVLAPFLCLSTAMWTKVPDSGALLLNGVFGGATLAMLYVGFAWSFNSTFIRVTQGVLETRLGPLPWPGATRLRASDVRQLFCTTPPTGDDELAPPYYLEALMANGRRVTLLSGSRSLLKFLEREVESYLGIVNRRVRGEAD